MKEKTNVIILCGGKSAEHEISLLSAKNIVEALDKEKYDINIVGIDKVSGQWTLCIKEQPFLNDDDAKKISLNKQAKSVALLPGRAGELIDVTNGKVVFKADIVFPILHGPNGEDGTIQGLLTLAGVAFVGASVIGSAVGMDKEIMKRLLREQNIPVADFLVFKQGEKVDFIKVSQTLGLPLFIKPANMGSSVGISKVTDGAGFEQAIKEAFLYDTKILIEEMIVGREIECAVLGNKKLITSELGEIIPQKDFYSYEAKYIDEAGAKLQIPASVSATEKEKIQRMAAQVFKALDCSGLGRVDFFLKEDGSLVVIEINTMPGFTKISMFPTLIGLSGISYPDLIDKLIQLGLERCERKQ